VEFFLLILTMFVELEYLQWAGHITQIRKTRNVYKVLVVECFREQLL